MQTTAYTADQLVAVSTKLANRSHLTHTDKEDLAQDLALEMLLAEKQADESRNVQGYQYTAARYASVDFFNRTLDRNRKEMAVMYQTVGEVDGEDIAMVDTLDNGDKSIIENTLTGDIANALETLPEREAMIVKRHLLEGETLTSIANDMEGLSVQRAYQLLTDAKGKLALALAEWKEF